MFTEKAEPSFMKFLRAYDILKRCIGPRGVWADPERYRNTCWTRDFAIAIQPALHLFNLPDVARRHLSNLASEQRDNGQMPILFLDNEKAWLKMKRAEEVAGGRTPFMLRHYNEGNLWRLTPGTRDSEINFLIAIHEYSLATGDRNYVINRSLQINKALAYIEDNLMEDGLVIGCDWRDTMEVELGDKPLLTNNCLMYHAYKLMGMEGKAETLRQRILATHQKHLTLMDYPGADRFDPLGAAFAVLYDVAEPRMYSHILKSMKGVDTKHGVTIKCRHNPHTPEEAPVIKRTNGVVVWPFVVGFTAMAMKRMGFAKLGRQQMQKLTALDGLCEWYDPAAGRGYGAKEQLWSATLYMRAMMDLAHDD